MDDWPNPFDWDTDEENREAVERLKRHLRQAEDLKKNDPTLQSAIDQEVIQKAISDMESQLEAMIASRRRRRDFQRQKLLPPD